MNKRSNFLALAILVSSAFLMSSCKDETDETPQVNNSNLMLTLDGLEDLGSDYVYEGWIIVNGAAITTGTFTVDANGAMSVSSFEVGESDLTAASTFVLTIEPAMDPDPKPSSVHILAGDFSSNSAALNIGHMAALGDDYSSASGKYILATPTDTVSTNEASGIWFLDNSSGSPMVGLDLPTLPAGWAYEGWAVIDGTPVSTGTFTSLDMADNGAPFSGTMSGPPFPGEDFLMDAPSPLTFPVNLQSGTAVISIEPVPDNSAAPFVLKPLVGMIPSDAMNHTAYSMNQNLSFPSGTAKR